MGCAFPGAWQVNGDDPVAVISAFELAAEWRQTWQTDVTRKNLLELAKCRGHFN